MCDLVDFLIGIWGGGCRGGGEWIGGVEEFEEGWEDEWDGGWEIEWEWKGDEEEVIWGIVLGKMLYIWDEVVVKGVVVERKIVGKLLWIREGRRWKLVLDKWWNRKWFLWKVIFFIVKDFVCGYFKEFIGFIFIWVINEYISSGFRWEYGFINRWFSGEVKIIKRFKVIVGGFVFIKKFIWGKFI